MRLLSARLLVMPKSPGSAATAPVLKVLKVNCFFLTSAAVNEANEASETSKSCVVPERQRMLLTSHLFKPLCLASTAQPLPVPTRKPRWSATAPARQGFMLTGQLRLVYDRELHGGRLATQ